MIVFFKNGHVDRLQPEPDCEYSDPEIREKINESTTIISDGTFYNLEDINSIRSIEIPKYDTDGLSDKAISLGVTGCLEYVLRMHAGICWDSGEYEISICCLEKAMFLMKESSVKWMEDDYKRIVYYLLKLRKYKSAKKWIDWINENIPNEIERQTKNILNMCRDSNTDYIQVGYSSSYGCCEQCAKYRKRIYSISGNDKRFPLFPKDHIWCATVYLTQYTLGSYITFSDGEYSIDWAIKKSNRPYIDDRTDDERKSYEDMRFTTKEMERKKKEKTEHEKEVEVSRAIYLKLQEMFPDRAPKSLSGFSRMRNTNSKKYQELKEEAEKMGFVFPTTLEEILEWEDF